MHTATRDGDVRRQLTLFVPPAASAALEVIRAQVDPVQFHLIAAHVTLAREDELEQFTDTTLRARVAAANIGPLTLAFGAPEPTGAHGVLLPCGRGLDAFQALRRVVLATADPRISHAHLTLAHPRNPRAVGNTAEAYVGLPNPLTITFDSIDLIEQRDGAQWQRIACAPLDGSPSERA